MLTVKVISKRVTPDNMRVRNMVTMWAMLCDTLDEFEEGFLPRLKAMKNTSAFPPWISYVLRRSDKDLSIEIWHKNLQGELDKKIQVITETEN